MTKRIFSGLFILVAVGALGVIVAGAVAEGDQLLVRFLTAVVVAALGLYVVSDLRLQATRSRAVAISGATPIQRAATGSIADTASDYLASLQTESVEEREYEAVGATYSNGGSVGYDLAELEELRESLSDLNDDDLAVTEPIASATNEDLVALVESSSDLEETQDQFAWPNTDTNPVVDVEDSAPVEAAVDEIVIEEAKEQTDVAEEVEASPVETEASSVPVQEVELPEPEIETADEVFKNAVTDLADVPAPKVEQPVVEEPETIIDLTVEPVAKAPVSEPVDLSEVIDLRENDVVEFQSSLDEALRLGEATVVDTLINQGMLSTDGPITDRDVRTMVYVAFTSNELRKLIQAGGVPGTNNPEIDLGPVELFDESRHSPAPKTVYQVPQIELPEGE